MRFTSLLLAFMRAAPWDIAAARSMKLAAATTDNFTTSTTTVSSATASHHAKYAMEYSIFRKGFQVFDHETFYMDGNLSSLLSPDQFRRDCFSQHRDMKAMELIELLGILSIGKFCSRKHVAIVHPKMEQSLFGNLEQHQQVIAGRHPRSVHGAGQGHLIASIAGFLTRPGNK